MDKVKKIIKFVNDFCDKNNSNENSRTNFIEKLLIRNEILGNKIFIMNDDKIDEIHHDTPLLKNIKISSSGQNSLILMDGLPIATNLNIDIGENSFVFIGKDFKVRHNCYINIASENSILVIGNNANWGSGTIQISDENDLKVIIGNNFLAATNTYIRASDGHVIYELDNPDKIINASKYGIFIGNHVWLGHNVTILKDSEIPDNCIIAACSVVVRKKFIPYCIIGGNPARIIRANVAWDTKTIPYWKRKNNIL